MVLGNTSQNRDRTRQLAVDRDASHAKGHHQSVESTHSWDVHKAWSSQEWKADEVMDDRTVQPVVASSARTHEFQSSFSHVKTKHVILEEEETHDRTVQPVVCPQRGAIRHQFIIGDDEAELELSLGSRSFLDRVTENDENHFVKWRMFMSVTLETAVFMGKNYSDNWNSIKNTKDLTMKRMFDISSKLVSE